MSLSCTPPATSGSRTGRSRRSSKPTDAIIRLAATCVCGSDLWPYRGVEPLDEPRPMGHEYVGIVEEVGGGGHHRQAGPVRRRLVLRLRQHLRDLPGRLPDLLRHREAAAPGGAQAERMRVPLADGTLVATPDMPGDDLVPSLLAASDVLGTGWFAAVAAEAGPGKTVAVVGDGAVGLLGVLAAKQLGAERIIAMSRHEPRQKLAVEFGATDIVTERGDDGVARVKELTDGLGAHSVIEAVGTQESMMQAIRATRPGGHVGYVGVTHDVSLPGEELFFSHVHLHGGPAPVRRFLPDLIDRIWNRQIDPGKVFDLELPARRGRRRLPGHGRAPRHQGPPAHRTGARDADGRRVRSMTTADFPGVRWHGHWVAPDVPDFVIDPTSVGGDLPPAGFSRAQFRRVFDVEEVPARVPLRLSADSRYVLWVNGVEVGRGPIRSQPRRLRYDEYDIADAPAAGTQRAWRSW